MSRGKILPLSARMSELFRQLSYEIYFHKYSIINRMRCKMRCHHLIPSWQRGCTFKFRRIFLHTLDLSAKAGFASGQGPAIQALNAMLADIARTDIAVLLIKKGGSAKEV